MADSEHTTVPALCSIPFEASDEYLNGLDESEDDFDPGDECGRWDNGRLGKYCQLAGTEFCDWECPYGD